MEVGGRPAIERVIECVSPLSDDVFISANSPEKYSQFGLRLVADIYPDKAALGGIFSAISAARYPHVLVVACDLPLLNVALLRYLIELAPAADVIAPLIQPPQPETTHTVYSRHCLPAIEARLQVGRLRIIGFFEDVRVRYVDRAEIARFDPQFHSFVNMNTPDDWERVKKLVSSSKNTDIE